MYRQVAGVATGTPLEANLVNTLSVFHETQWLQDSPLQLKLMYYRSCVHDIFVLFKSSEHLLHFPNYLNPKYPNISLPSESESNNKMFFLDAEISRGNGRFKTTVHRNLTFSCVYTHFDSFLSTASKFSMI